MYPTTWAHSRSETGCGRTRNCNSRTGGRKPACLPRTPNFSVFVVAAKPSWEDSDRSRLLWPRNTGWTDDPAHLGTRFHQIDQDGVPGDDGLLVSGRIACCDFQVDLGRKP